MRVMFLLFLLVWAFNVAADVEVSRVDLVARAPGQEIDFELTLRNTGGEELSLITQIPVAWHDLRLDRLPAIVGSGEAMTFRVRGPVSRYLGVRNHRIDVLKGDGSVLKLAVPVFAYSGFASEPSPVDFGVVKSGEMETRVVGFSTDDYDDFEFSTAEDVGHLVAVTVREDRRSLELSVPRDAAWGMHKGWIKAKTNLVNQPEVWSEYVVEVRGAVRPNSYDINSGLLRKGGIPEQLVFFEHESDGRVKLGEIQVVGSKVDVEQRRCPHRGRGCRALSLVVREDNPSGQFEAFVNVELPDFQQWLKLRISGVLVDPDREILDLLPSPNVDPRGTGDAGSSVIRALGEITHNTQGPLAMPEPAGEGPLLSWTVRNDARVFGYLVYRADRPDGRFVRVSENFVRALPTEDGRAVTYKWRDVSDLSSDRYWYKVVTINMHAQRADLTGTILWERGD